MNVIGRMTVGRSGVGASRNRVLKGPHLPQWDPVDCAVAKSRVCNISMLVTDEDEKIFFRLKLVS